MLCEQVQALTDELERSQDAAQAQEDQLRAELADAQCQVQSPAHQGHGLTSYIALLCQTPHALLSPQCSEGRFAEGILQALCM